jgi:GT2 family glycosyltransferase
MSLKNQSMEASIIVVDNASSDGSIRHIEKKYPEVSLIKLRKNRGFAGGVNAGIKHAIEQGSEYIALLNNDAVADKNWIKNLVEFLESHPEVGIATSKITDADQKFFDSTGDIYTIWGLPYPRGRGEDAKANKYDETEPVFGASGGASLYRVEMLKQIGLFDEDFFAYYEDVDLSFRAQLAGWQVFYIHNAVAYHHIGATSSKIKGFATYHTLKNLPLLLWKNVPWRLMPKIWPRLVITWGTILASALSRGQLIAVTKGIFMGTLLWPIKLFERRKIQKHRKVPVNYIDSIIIHDLPPNARKLRAIRSRWWRLTGRAE